MSEHGQTALDNAKGMMDGARDALLDWPPGDSVDHRFMVQVGSAHALIAIGEALVSIAESLNTMKGNRPVMVYGEHPS
jgi:hypothetical protein